MVSQDYEVSDRELNFKLHRLNCLDQEITRYRDSEWKVTSFHTAFFVAILYLLIDLDKYRNVLNTRYSIFYFVFVYLYLIIAISQLFWIHRKLNMTRNERSKLLQSIGASSKPPITKLWGFYEYPGAHFIICFIIFLMVLAIVDLFLLCDLNSSTCCSCCCKLFWLILIPIGVIILIRITWIDTSHKKILKN